MLLSINHATKKFGGVTALDNCSVSLTEGRITAIIGPNGAGKTTLFDAISGLIPLDAGSISFADQDMSLLQEYERANAGIVRTWQQVRLFKNLTIADHLAMVENNEDIRLFRSFFRSNHIHTEEYTSYIKKFGIDRPADTIVRDLSYGQRKLLQLAIALRKPHKLLLLDEPVAGVNSIIQRKIETLLLELKKKGETIAIIEHDMEFIKKLADTVVVMDAGKVLIEGLPKEVLSNKMVIKAYLGE